MIPPVTQLADLDPLPRIPHESAAAGFDALLLAVAAGPRLGVDPYADAKAANFTRLMFDRMPILCDGPTGLHTIGTDGIMPPGQPGGLMILSGQQTTDFLHEILREWK